MKRAVIFDFFNGLEKTELAYFIDLLLAFFPIPKELDYNSFKSNEVLSQLLTLSPPKWIGLFKTFKKVI